MDDTREESARSAAPWNAVRFEDIPLRDVPQAPAPEDEPFAPEELEESVARAEQARQVDFIRPIPGGRFKSFVKRLVRKLIRFCVEPLALEVSAFHAAAARALRALQRFAAEQLRTGERREAELAALRERVAALEARVEELEKDRP